VRGDALCALLDDQGFAVAAGAACHSGEREPSSALAALGVGRSLALGALRSSFGECNDVADGERLATAVATIVPMLRVASTAVRA
jgi:cysteine desulfurase